jgi:hypothetical protein
MQQASATVATSAPISSASPSSPAAVSASDDSTATPKMTKQERKDEGKRRRAAAKALYVCLLCFERWKRANALYIDYAHLFFMLARSNPNTSLIDSTMKALPITRSRYKTPYVLRCSSLLGLSAA